MLLLKLELSAAGFPNPSSFFNSILLQIKQPTVKPNKYYWVLCAIGGIQKNMVLKLKGLKSDCDTKITSTKLTLSIMSFQQIYVSVSLNGSKQFRRRYMSCPKPFQACVFPMWLKVISLITFYSMSFPAFLPSKNVSAMRSGTTFSFP